MAYQGYLTEWIPEIIRLHNLGMSPHQIASAIRPLVYSSGVVYLNPGYPEAANIRYVLVREGLMEKRPEKKKEDAEFVDARRDYVAMLRLEGETLDKIAARLGISRERVRQIVRKAGEKWQRSMRRATFTVHSGPL